MSQSDRLLLDTHTLIWTLEGSSRLGQHAVAAIEAAFKSENIYVSGTSLWEIGCLAAKGKIRVPDLRDYWLEALRQLKSKELPIDRKVIFEFFALDGLHNDPSDRFLVATAILNDLVLVTADEKIIQWSKVNLEKLEVLDARPQGVTLSVSD